MLKESSWRDHPLTVFTIFYQQHISSSNLFFSFISNIFLFILLSKYYFSIPNNDSLGKGGGRRRRIGRRRLTNLKRS